MYTGYQDCGKSYSYMKGIVKLSVGATSDFARSAILQLGGTGQSVDGIYDQSMKDKAIELYGGAPAMHGGIHQTLSLNLHSYFASLLWFCAHINKTDPITGICVTYTIVRIDTECCCSGSELRQLQLAKDVPEACCFRRSDCYIWSHT